MYSNLELEGSKVLKEMTPMKGDESQYFKQRRMMLSLCLTSYSMGKDLPETNGGSSAFQLFCFKEQN